MTGKRILSILIVVCVVVLGFIFLRYPVATSILSSMKDHIQTDIERYVSDYFKDGKHTPIQAIYTNKNGFVQEVTLDNINIVTNYEHLDVDKKNKNDTYTVHPYWTSGELDGSLTFNITYEDGEIKEGTPETPLSISGPNFLSSAPNFMDNLQQDNLTYIDLNGQPTTIALNKDTVMAFDALVFIPDSELEKPIGPEYETYSLDIYLKNGKILNGKVYTSYSPLESDKTASKLHILDTFQEIPPRKFD